MSGIKIRSAYCVELDRVISIGEARVEYFAQSKKESERKRFHFLCSTPECRHSDLGSVKVTGANYSVLRKVDEKGKQITKEAHYRRSRYDTPPHSANCEWVVLDDYMNNKKPHVGETTEAYAQRCIVNKLFNFIDIYNSSDNSDENKLSVKKNVSPSPNSGKKSNSLSNQDKLIRQRPALTTTTVLSRLVESWSGAKEMLSESEFSSLQFTVNGKKESLKRYFKHIKYAIKDHHHGVVYGGARLKCRYNKGFKLEFFDPVDKKTVYIYCPNELMQKSRYSNYIHELLEHERCYFKIFMVNPDLKIGSEGKNYTYEITDLKNFDIVMVQKS